MAVPFTGDLSQEMLYTYKYDANGHLSTNDDGQCDILTFERANLDDFYKEAPNFSLAWQQWSGFSDGVGSFVPYVTSSSQDMPSTCDLELLSSLATSTGSQQHSGSASSSDHQVAPGDVVTTVPVRKFDSWTHAGTLALITLVKDHMVELSSPTVARTRVWTIISAELVNHNLMFSADQCCNKWKNLKKKYREYKDNCNATGRGRQKFLYMSEMDDLLGGRQSTSCTHVVSTMPLGQIPIIQSTTNSLNHLVTLTDAPVPETSETSTEASMKRKKSSKTKSDCKKSNDNEFHSFVMGYFTQKKENMERRAEEAKNRDVQKQELKKQQLAIEERKLDLFSKLLDKL